MPAIGRPLNICPKKWGGIQGLISASGKPWERVLPILVTPTSHSDFNFERSNIGFKENNQMALILVPANLTTALERTKEKSAVFGRLI